MGIREMKYPVEDKIPIQNVLVSVFNKSGLESLVPGLVESNPGIRFISTGGTYNRLREFLGDDSDATLMDVSEYTGQLEMEGGLVKTLHPKIFAGLLGERNNPSHQQYLRELNGDFIDLVVVNLYPFTEVVSGDNVSFEMARGNIDIGGPSMIRAGAKNFPSVAVLTSSVDYSGFLLSVNEHGGCTSFSQRLSLARLAFSITGEYEAAIGRYLAGSEGVLEKVRSNYGFAGADN
jgi:phosphoribosylaminoimidazolecarboxamide formyltransferase / IMP cyclohydrolase